MLKFQLSLGLLLFLSTNCAAISAQSTVSESRPISGERFFTKQRLAEWERVLREGPKWLNKVSVEGFSKAESTYSMVIWVDGDHRLKQMKSKNHYPSTDISNPRYLARINFQGKEPSLDSFYEPRNDAIQLWRDSTIFAGSSFGRKSIPEYLREGKIEVRDVREQGDFLYARFFPLANDDTDDDFFNQIEYVELRFNHRFPPLPDEYAFKYKEGENKRIFVFRQFVQVDAAWFPTIGGTIFANQLDFPDSPDWSNFSDWAKIKYDLDDRLDPQQCYLTYYGIAEPNMPPVADFGRGTIRWFWPITLAVALALVMTGYYLYRRRF